MTKLLRYESQRNVKKIYIYTEFQIAVVLLNKRQIAVHTYCLLHGNLLSVLVISFQKITCPKFRGKLGSRK